jgi:hypothetical protein
MHVEVGRLGRTATLVVCRLGCGCVALGVLLAVGWLQPRLNRELPAAPSTRAPAASRVTTSPTVVTTSGPQGSPGIRKIADTAPVDDIAVTPRSVWIAAGGLVVRVDPRSRRRVVVPGIEQTEPPVVQLTAGAVWATTTAGQQLLRIDPRTVRLAASLKVPAHGVAADGRGVCGWCVAKWAPAGSSRGSIRSAAGSWRSSGFRGTRGRLGSGRAGCGSVTLGLVWRVDPTSNHVVATIRLPASHPGTGERGGDVAVTKDAAPAASW